MRDLAVAIGFLTRLPAGRSPRLGAGALERALPWFPVVGLLVGGVMGGVRALAGLALHPAPATVLALIAAVLVTGALHEDGLADSADAIGAHVSRERRLEILHDSRVGTFGALALLLAALLTVTALVPLGDERFLRAAIAGHVLGRWSTLPLAALAPPSAAAASGTLVRGGPGTVAAGTLAAMAIVLAACGPGPAAVAIGAALAATAAGACVALRALGGVSGDVYGAVNKLAEIAAYCALAAAWTG